MPPPLHHVLQTLPSSASLVRLTNQPRRHRVGVPRPGYRAARRTVTGHGFIQCGYLGRYLMRRP